MLDKYGGSPLKKTLVEIYALAVCFFTLACFVVFLGMATWDLVQIAVPEFTISTRDYAEHLDDETYRKELERNARRYSDQEIEIPSGDALTKMRVDSWEHELKLERRSAFQGLVSHLIILLIATLVFFVHWRIARRSS